MIKQILHASFLVSDLEKSIAFYRDVLGLKIDMTRPDMNFAGAWLNMNNSNQQIHLLVLPNPDPVENRPQHGGRDRHVAFATDNLAVLSESLDLNGVPYSLSKSARKALFCRDPDGNALEFIEER